MPFSRVDLFIKETDALVSGGNVSDFAKAHLAGAIAVMSSATFELCIKEILYDFSQKRDVVFGAYVRNNYAKLNGRIQTDDLKNDFLKKCGGLFKDRFQDELDRIKNQAKQSGQRDPAESYNSLVMHRHKFAHELNTQISYEDVKEIYRSGIVVIDIFRKTLT